MNSHSKPSDLHSDRRHGHQSGTPNKHHQDHRHGSSSSDHRSGRSTHRSSSHEKRPTEHGISKESQHHQQKASRTPQKLSTGSKDYSMFAMLSVSSLSTGSDPFCSPIQQEKSIPCSSPMLQQQQQLRPLMMPSTPGQQQPSFPPPQPPQFMSPHQQHPPIMLQQQPHQHQPQPNGPPVEGGMNVHPYQQWNPAQLPPMHGREQGVYPPGIMPAPLLQTVFSPHSGGGGPSGHGDYHVPPQQYPPASIDTLCMY